PYDEVNLLNLFQFGKDVPPEWIVADFPLGAFGKRTMEYFPKNPRKLLVPLFLFFERVFHPFLSAVSAHLLNVIQVSYFLKSKMKYTVGTVLRKIKQPALPWNNRLNEMT